MTIEKRFAKRSWLNNIYSSRIGQFVEPSNTFCPLFPPSFSSCYKNLGHRMESWDIAYEPRTGRRNHRAIFSHLSSFLRFVFSFFSWCRGTPTANHFRIYLLRSRDDSLWTKCVWIELKRILRLKFSLKIYKKKEVKSFVHDYVILFFSFLLKNYFSNLCTVIDYFWLLPTRCIFPVGLSTIDFERGN